MSSAPVSEGHRPIRLRESLRARSGASHICRLLCPSGCPRVSFRLHVRWLDQARSNIDADLVPFRDGLPNKLAHQGIYLVT